MRRVIQGSALDTAILIVQNQQRQRPRRILYPLLAQPGGREAKRQPLHYVAGRANPQLGITVVARSREILGRKSAFRGLVLAGPLRVAVDRRIDILPDAD